MESRKITIVSSSAQSKKEIMSAATTLGELKADLAQAGIDYEGMTFMEGYSKTELKTDESVLPHDIPTKNGNRTNELVFMLTAPQKKIKSGALDRRGCYDFMKKNPEAASAFKAKFGKNFTNGSTADLVSFVGSYERKKATKTAKTVVKVEVETPTAEPKGDSCPACEAAKALVEDIYGAGGLSEANYNNLINVLNGGEAGPVDHSLTEEEIDDMFDFCK